VSKTFFVKVDAWKASTRCIRGPEGIFENLVASETWNFIEFLRDTQQLSATAAQHHDSLRKGRSVGIKGQRSCSPEGGLSERSCNASSLGVGCY
jgi:hypothetical protein